MITIDSSYYRARYYDAAIGRFMSEDPIGLSGGMNFYSYVEAGPTTFRDPSGRTKIPMIFWGWWCGPNWTGGRFEQYDPAHDTHGYYHEPLDATDRVCKDHDICYYKCRIDHPCDRQARGKCMRLCNGGLILNAPTNGAGPWIAFGIDVFNDDPDAGDNAKNCPECTQRKKMGGHK